MNVSNVASGSHAERTVAQGGFKQRAQDFKALDSALQSGDLAAAQTAMDTLQQHLQQKPGVAHGRHLFGRNSQGGQDFQAVQNALQSGDLAGAQQAFATLKQDVQSARYIHRQTETPVDTSGETTGTTPAPISDPTLDPVPSADPPPESAAQTSASLLDVQA